MTELEEKTLNLKVELHEDIAQYNNMIMYYLANLAKNTINEYVKPHVVVKRGEENVTIPLEVLLKIKDALEIISSEENYSKLNSWMNEQYIIPKKVKLEILNKL